MKEPLQLLNSIVNDSANRCPTHICVRRDIITISNRFEHEGLSFMTITLPNFLEHFMTCLEKGFVDSTDFPGWKKSGCLPAFLRGFTSRVFDAEGKVLQHECVKSIHAVRQICSFYKKVKLSCTKARTKKAFSAYKAIDSEIQNNLDFVMDTDLDTFRRVSRIVISTIFPDGVNSDELIPHHGPGSTSEKIQGNAKYVPNLFKWHDRLNNSFRLEETLFSSAECYNKSEQDVETLPMEEELPVRVISVPKTLKTPRIIALEPVAVQMCQQGIKDYVVEKIEQNHLVGGQINFSDQSINRRLALHSSVDKSMATLDLSAASDRIHKDFIWIMLEVNPTLRDLVFNTRSLRANVGGEIIFLNKFASMGSALCFPMEALFFMILCIMGHLKEDNLPVTLNNIRSVIKSLYVYGDDIIVPQHTVGAVVETLSNFGNVVGLSKSFSKGYFRESCGMDAYKGVDITPIYMRNIPPTARYQSTRIISCIDTANQLFLRGFVNTAQILKKKIEQIIGKLPMTSDMMEGIGWRFGDVSEKKRFSKKYQRIEVLTFVPQMSLRKDKVDGYNALTKCLLKLHRKPLKNGPLKWQKHAIMHDNVTFNDERHLRYTSSFGTLTLKRRWVAQLL